MAMGSYMDLYNQLSSCMLTKVAARRPSSGLDSGLLIAAPCGYASKSGAPKTR